MYACAWLVTRTPTKDNGLYAAPRGTTPDGSLLDARALNPLTHVSISKISTHAEIPRVVLDIFRY